MGRQGSPLLRFLKSGLIEKKYPNLIFEDEAMLIFSIILPHKTKMLCEEDEQIFKDWYELNKKEYVFGSKDYTKAKQALIASLKKSDYVEKVPNSPKKLMYKILKEGKNKENKRLKKEFKKGVVETEALYTDDTLPSVESGYASAVDSPPSGNSVEPSKGSFTTSSSNGLSQQPCVKANSLFQKNDIQQTIYSSPFTLNEFVMSEAMDDSVSAENSVADLDVTTSVEDFLTNIQPFIDNLRSTDYFNENPEYPTPGLNLMECSSENSELSSSGLIENGPAENEVMKRCNFLQFTNISDEELNNFIIKNIPALNSNPSMANYENLNNHASEIQNMHEQHTEYQDLLTKELRNKPMENISNINSRPFVSFEENIPEQIFSSQGNIKTDFEEMLSKDLDSKLLRITSLDHLAIFLKPNVE